MIHVLFLDVCLNHLNIDSGYIEPVITDQQLSLFHYLNEDLNTQFTALRSSEVDHWVRNVPKGQELTSVVILSKCYECKCNSNIHIDTNKRIPKKQTSYIEYFGIRFNFKMILQQRIIQIKPGQ